MDSIEPNIPENSCAYEKYDPLTLTPLNTSTCTRLTELDWTPEIFSNKTVLDIGCNSGILSLYASKLGAAAVKAVDVQEPLVEFFSSVVVSHDLPIHVERRGFNELDTEFDCADIVLFMEVLHWIVDQKGDLRDAIYKLAMLTEETLFLETPWDIKEPSIASRGVISEEQYDIEIIIREIGKYFKEVELVRFMTYFGKMQDSKRILIKASGKRKNAECMRHLDNTNELDIPLTRGNNDIHLLSSPNGPLVLKKLPIESMLPLLDNNTQKTLFNTLEDSNGALLPAMPIGERYIIENKNDEKLMLFPFVGRLSDHFPTHRHHTAVEDPLSLAVECRRVLSQLPDSVIESVKANSRPLSLKPRVLLGGLFNTLINNKGLSSFIDQIYAAHASGNRNIEDAVVHNDLQLGNMIADSTGKHWIIDLDIMRSGTAYSDFICCAIYNNCAHDEIYRLYTQMTAINERPMLFSDMQFAMTIMLRWIYELNTHHQTALVELAEPAVNGMHTLYRILTKQKADLLLAS